MREKILFEIQRIAKSNGGKPPGRSLFETETGIRKSKWEGVIWARWSDAVSEAGFTPNARNEKLVEMHLLQKLVSIFRHYRKFPTVAEMRLYRKIDPNFTNHSVLLEHFGGIQNLRRQFSDWANKDGQYSDISVMLVDVTRDEVLNSHRVSTEGYVYLIKSGVHYKIGRSDDLERRVKEIRVALPEAASLYHTIQTDDPPGIESYWHRRFADRRANGEWFKLTSDDVAAFRRRKFQ